MSDSWKYFNPVFEYEETFPDFGCPWYGHKFFAYDLVSNLKPQLIVELGTHRGTSFWSFCQAVKDKKIDVRLYAIDSWKGEKHAGFYGEEIFEEVKEIQKKYYRDLKINLIRKNFDDALPEFHDSSIDLLHIDGLHTYEAVKHDYENWNSKVKDDGMIIFHDIFVNQKDFGVFRFWEGLKKKSKAIEFHHSFGLGVLFKSDSRCEYVMKNEKKMQMTYSFLSEDKKNRQINLLINQKDREMNKFALAFQQKEQEINAMKSSKFWKMRNKYMKLKKLIFR